MKKFLHFALGVAVGAGLFIGVPALAASKEVKAYITDFKLLVNGNSVNLQNKVIVVDGTSYLPVREISNIVGYQVEWDGDTETIGLSNDGKKYLETDKKGEENKPVSEEVILTETHYVDNLIANYSVDGKISVDLVKDAIKNGALTVNSQDRATGNSLLILAVLEDNFPLYDYLKRAPDLNVNLQNKEGRTALHVAAIEKKGFYLGELLVYLKATTKLTDNYGKKPIDYTERYSTEYRSLRNYRDQ